MDCAVNLRGLRGECAAGSKVHTFDVTDDVWLAPGATYVVADTGNPAVNHLLPSPLGIWAGEPGDVLRNDGDTVTLLVDSVVIDSVTYPKLKLAIGASMAFPSDCPAARRTDWTAWQVSTASWFPGFEGTPNGANVDVSWVR